MIRTYTELDDLELHETYNSKFKRCEAYIFNTFPNLKKPQRFVFFKSGKCNGYKNPLFMPEIKDSDKAYCTKNDSTIYISDWALIAFEDQLIHIMLHELLHINYPYSSENEIISLTEKYFTKIMKKNPMNGLLPIFGPSSKISCKYFFIDSIHQ